MIEITQHIEQLLLQHDCVIVPGLGGFVAQNCSATFVEEEGVFLPPYRSVTFNPRLTMNDALLVQHIAQVHGITYREALNFVEGQVENIHRTIQEEGFYTLYGIGTLSTSLGSGYEFKPEDCGIASPQWFGLDSFGIEPLVKEEAKPAKVEIKQEDEETYTVNVRIGLLRYAAVAAVAAVFFFLCIAPIKSAINQNASEASMFRQLWSLVVPASNNSAQDEAANSKVTTQLVAAPTTPATAPVAHKSASIMPQPAAKSAEMPTATTANTTKATTKADDAAEKAEQQEEGFTIVIASSISRHGAERMVKKWKEDGKGDLRIVKKHHKTCVAYGNYPTEKEARKALKKLSSSDSDFESAWVYELH